MNRVILVGRLTKDPQIASTKDGKSVARFNVAVNRRGKDAGADFPSCIAFDKTAEIIEKYFAQGKEIALEGRIQTGSYTNKEGQKVYTTDILVDNVEFVGSKSDKVEKSEPEPTPAGFISVQGGIDEELPFM